MEETCNWCSTEKEIDREDWFSAVVNGDWMHFCCLQCRAHWAWKEGWPMP